MSKFCTNCGNQMDDQSTFCPNCGTACEAAPAPAQEQAPEQKKAPAAKKSINDIVTSVTTFVSNYVKAAKKDKKLIIIPAAAVVVVIALMITLSVLFGGNGYESAIKNQIAIQTGKASTSQLKNSMPKDMLEYLEDEFDFDMDDRIDDYKDEAEDRVDELEDEYGKNFKVKYKITDEDELSKSKLKDLKDELKEIGIDKDDVKKAYKLDIEWEIKGSEDDKDGEAEDVIVVKIGSKWYLLSGLL